METVMLLVSLLVIASMVLAFQDIEADQKRRRRDIEIIRQYSMRGMSSEEGETSADDN